MRFVEVVAVARTANVYVGLDTLETRAQNRFVQRTVLAMEIAWTFDAIAPQVLLASTVLPVRVLTCVTPMDGVTTVNVSVLMDGLVITASFVLVLLV